MKPGLFSFIGDEFENVFHYSDLFLPGIEKIAESISLKAKDKSGFCLEKRDHEIEYNFNEV